MIANNLMPSEPVHPGTLLKEEIEYRGYIVEATGAANGSFLFCVE